MASPSVERRERRAGIEKARQGPMWTSIWTTIVVVGIWSVVWGTLDPRDSGTRVALCVVASIIALAFALAARRIAPEKRRDSPRWYLLAGFAMAFAAVAGYCFDDDPVRSIVVGLSVVVAVVSVLGKLPQRERTRS